MCSEGLMLGEHWLSVFGNPCIEPEASLAFLFFSGAGVGGWAMIYAVWVPQLSGGGVRLGSSRSVSWPSCWGGADSGLAFMEAARGHQAARRGFWNERTHSLATILHPFLPGPVHPGCPCPPHLETPRAHRDLAAEGKESNPCTHNRQAFPHPALKLAPSAFSQGLFLMDEERERSKE